MSYIDFEEFKELTGAADEYKDNFDKYLVKATAAIDNVTNYFYQFNDITKDSRQFRVKQFKLALCAQIMYFVDVGADTYESINNAPKAFQQAVRVFLMPVATILLEITKVSR